MKFSANFLIYTLSSIILIFSCAPSSPANNEVSFPEVEVSFPTNNSVLPTNFSVYGSISSTNNLDGLYLIAGSQEVKASIYKCGNTFYWEKEFSIDNIDSIKYFLKLKSSKNSITNSIQIQLSNLPFVKIYSPSNTQKASSNVIDISGEIYGDLCTLNLILNLTNTNSLQNIKGNWQTKLSIERGVNILIAELIYNQQIVSKKRVVFLGPSTDAYTMQRKLGKGVNMGNSLEAYPDENSWGNPIKDEYFYLMKNAGFDTVRIPIRWSAHALTTPPYTIDSNFMQRVDHVVNVALSNGLNVIINIHHYEELMSSPLSHKDRFLSLWRQISTHFRDMPDNLLFEILNEPNGNAETYWTDLFTNALAIIRESNPTRNVIIGGINWNSIDGLNNLDIPAKDGYIIATFHFYEPFIFTHQGAEWSEGMDKVSNIIWPGPPPTPVPIPEGIPDWIRIQLEDYNTKQGASNPASSNQITSRLDVVSNWAAKNNIPVWLGEFGVYGKYADINSRVRWTHFVRKEAEKRNISWCYWEFSSGFGIYNPSTQKWITELSNALLSD